MNPDSAIREQLITLLNGGEAHMPLKEAVSDFPEKYFNSLFPNGTYSPWALLEHIRITQWDILDFIRNPNYVEISWPDDYWPAKGRRATKKEWDSTISRFENDVHELREIVKNP